MSYWNPVSTLRPRQMTAGHFAKGIFKCIWFCENLRILIQISMKFVRNGPINTKPVLVQIMACCWTGDKPIHEPIVALTHKCVTRPRWVHAKTVFHMDGLVQDCIISIASELEILQSCIKPSICLVSTHPWCRYSISRSQVLTLRWCHNGHDGVSSHQPHHCLLNRLLWCRSKKTSKLRVTGLCAVPGEFPAQSFEMGQRKLCFSRASFKVWKWVKGNSTWYTFCCVLSWTVDFIHFHIHAFYRAPWLAKPAWHIERT